jgi:drug/metabolite transporter (DMT)-like permease
MVKHNNLYGIFFMVVNAFALPTLYAVQKQLLKTLSAPQMTFLYKLAVFVFFAPWALRKGFKALHTPVLPLHILRALLSTTAGILFAFGLQHKGIVSATAIQHMEQVFWVMIGAIYFKEKINATKVTAILISFIAVVLVTMPQIPEVIWNALTGNTGSQQSIEFDYHYIFVIGAVICWTINSTVVKVLGKTVKNDVQAFYVLLFSVIIAYPTAFFKWQWHQIGESFMHYPSFNGLVDLSNFTLNDTQVIQILVLALLYFTHLFAFFLAMKYAEMSTVAPFDYLKLIFSCVLAYFFTGDLPNETSQYVGYVLIILAGVSLVTSERRRLKKQEKLEKLETQIENV